MKLTKNQIILISFMLFSLFFGAGNLIFPPFLGQNAANHTPQAIMFFMITAVLLPVLGVVVVAKFKSLETLASKVDPKFAIIYSILIYLSVGPGLAIPRAASVPFEMAIAPYLGENVSVQIYLFIFSLVFFAIAYWLSSNPGKMVDRVGKYLTPALLIMIVFLFICFVFNGTKQIGTPQGDYVSNPYVKGFLEGYLTMDTIAALNFGFVIASTLQSLGVKNENQVVSYTVKCGIFAGVILAAVYMMLAYMGMYSSGVFALAENGAWTLRCIVYDLFGDVGAFLLASIFTLACLTTCVGLMTSCSQYFATLTKKIKYHHWLMIITLFSFAICNQGLTTLLKISIPILDAIYPIAIMLIVLGLCDSLFKDNKIIYPLTISMVGVVSVIYALHSVSITIPLLTDICSSLPFYSLGLGWCVVAAVCVVVSMILSKLNIKKC